MKTVAQCIPPGLTYFSNRADYLAKTGKQAPPFDPKRPVRLWGRPNADGSYPAYKSIAGPPTLALVPHDAIPAVTSKANALMEAFLGSQDAAGGVNIPGAYQYVSWEAWRLTRASSAVTATLSLFGVERSVGVPIEALFTATEASAATNEISPSAVSVIATDWNGVPAKYNYPEGEKRRVWSVSLPGMLLALSALFRQRTDSPAGNTQNGIGSPGHWDISDAGAIWKSVAPDLGDGRTGDVPVPSVDLAADEEVAMIAMSGMPVIVVRTRGEASGPLPPVPSGGLSAADAAKLQEIWAAVKLIVERTGG